MPLPPDWKSLRPDFADKDKYEEEGWLEVKSKSGDLGIQDDEITQHSIGSIAPKEKFARVHYYQNDNLELFTETLDFFDQGTVLIVWSPEPEVDATANIGAAILIKNQWFIKKSEEQLYLKIMGDREEGPTEVVIFFKNHRLTAGPFSPGVSLTVKRSPE